MKNITLILAFIGMMTLQSCEVTEVYETVDKSPRTEVFEVTTSFNSNNNYSKLTRWVKLNKLIFNIVYRSVKYEFIDILN